MGNGADRVGVYPTLRAFMESHPEIEDLGDLATQIPVKGTIGNGACERLFCRLAQQALRGELDLEDAQVCPQENCEMLRGTMCGLTGHKYRCLFHSPGDPAWGAIWRSVQLSECEIEVMVVGGR